MAFNDLFKLTSSGELVISDEAQSIPEYKRLITRDKGSKGDGEGRRKKQSKRELLYMYHMVHPASICANLPNYEKIVLAKRTADLDEDWKADKDVLKAIDRYKIDIKLTSTGNSYYAAEKSLFSMSEDIKFLQEQADNLKAILRDKSRELNANGIQKLEDTGLVKEVVALIKELSSVQKEIAKNIAELPKMKAVVDDLATKFAEEGGGKIKVVGNRELGNREL